jgi:hypothetical protein
MTLLQKRTDPSIKNPHQSGEQPAPMGIFDFTLQSHRIYDIIKIPLVAGTTGGIYKGTKNII